MTEIVVKIGTWFLDAYEEKGAIIKEKASSWYIAA